MNNPLHDIHQYSPTLTISQLLKFCEKKGLNVTRPMIQNYIRDGLLPPPVNKRLYTHKHLAALVMIDHLKSAFDIPMIKKTLTPFIDENGLGLDIYAQWIHKTAEAMSLWETHVAPAPDSSESGILSMMFAAELVRDTESFKL